MTVFGEARTIHQRFNYIVEIDGVTNAAFQDVSELSGEFSDTEYWAGGAVIPNKQPARLTFADITLQVGAATGDGDLYEWWQETASAVTGGGTVSPFYKRNLDIVQLDKDRSELRRWTVYGAYIKKYSPFTGLDNTSDEVTLEAIVLRYDYFEKSAEASPQRAA
jgi:phage tail-like protein